VPGAILEAIVVTVDDVHQSLEPAVVIRGGPFARSCKSADHPLGSETPSDLNRVNSFLTLRVADIWACYNNGAINDASPQLQLGGVGEWHAGA